MTAPNEHYIVYYPSHEDRANWHTHPHLLGLEEQDIASINVRSRNLNVTGYFTTDSSNHIIPAGSVFQTMTDESGRLLHRIAFPPSHESAIDILTDWSSTNNQPESFSLKAWTPKPHFPPTESFEAADWGSRPAYWKEKTGWGSTFGAMTRTLDRTIQIVRKGYPKEIYQVPKGTRFCRSAIEYSCFIVKPPVGEDVKGSPEADVWRLTETESDLNRPNAYILTAWTNQSQFEDMPYSPESVISPASTTIPNAAMYQTPATTIDSDD